jgi:hypothetical protein
MAFKAEITRNSSAFALILYMPGYQGGGP